jgi:transposase-like protein
LADTKTLGPVRNGGVKNHVRELGNKTERTRKIRGCFIKRAAGSIGQIQGPIKFFKDLRRFSSTFKDLNLAKKISRTVGTLKGQFT